MQIVADDTATCTAPLLCLAPKELEHRAQDSSLVGWWSCLTPLRTRLTHDEPRGGDRWVGTADELNGRGSHTRKGFG